MTKILKNNKGFTLVELMVALVIASSLMVCTSTILISQSSMATEINTAESAKIAGDNITTYMKNTLRNCKNIVLYDIGDVVKTNGVDEKVLYIDNGELYDNDMKVYGEMYSQFVIQYRVKLDNGTDGNGNNKPIVDLEVEVWDKQLTRLIYRSKVKVSLTTLEARGIPFKSSNYNSNYAVGTELLNPSIAYRLVTQNNVF